MLSRLWEAVEGAWSTPAENLRKAGNKARRDYFMRGANGPKMRDFLWGEYEMLEDMKTGKQTIPCPWHSFLVGAGYAPEDVMVYQLMPLIKEMYPTFTVLMYDLRDNVDLETPFEFLSKVTGLKQPKKHRGLAEWEEHPSELDDMKEGETIYNHVVGSGRKIVLFVFGMDKLFSKMYSYMFSWQVRYQLKVIMGQAFGTFQVIATGQGPNVLKFCFSDVRGDEYLRDIYSGWTVSFRNVPLAVRELG